MIGGRPVVAIDWEVLKSKFVKSSTGELLVFLFNELEDDGGNLVVDIDVDNENAQITKKDCQLVLYLANTPFIKSKSLDELFFAMLLLHIVFKIQFPQTIRNTAVFLLSVSGNKSLLQKEESLPDRIKSKLRKKYDMTA